MSFTSEQFRRNFRGHSTPSLLEDLFLFDSVSHEWYAGGFEFSEITLEDFKDHVDERSAPQFFGIGHDTSASMYALWLYESIPLDEAPVVYFSSEGEGSTVLASTISAFFTLLAWDEDPVLGVYQENEAEIQHTPRNQEFRAWIQKNYHLQPASQPNAVLQHAQLLHPTLPLNYPV